MPIARASYFFMAKKIKIVRKADKLNIAFSAYTQLQNVEYEIIVKNGGCIEEAAEKKFSTQTDASLEKEILISFSNENFYHLTGVHHSNLPKLLQYNRNGKTQSDFYADVKNGKLTISDLQTAERKDYILQRLEILANLEKIIDESVILRDYNGILYVKNKNTDKIVEKEKIKSANCFIYNNANELGLPEANNIFVFFSLDSTKKFPSKNPRFLTYCMNPCSIVFKEKIEEEDYNLGHNKITVLVRKKDYANNKRKTLYIAPGYIVNKINLFRKELDYYIEDKERLDELLMHPKITQEFKDEVTKIINSL